MFITTGLDISLATAHSLAQEKLHEKLAKLNFSNCLQSKAMEMGLAVPSSTNSASMQAYCTWQLDFISLAPR